MKATLEFDMTTDRYLFENAVNADSYRSALSNFYEWIRSKSKYDGADLDPTVVQQYFVGCLNDAGLTLESIT